LLVTPTLKLLSCQRTPLPGRLTRSEPQTRICYSIKGTCFHYSKRCNLDWSAGQETTPQPKYVSTELHSKMIENMKELETLAKTVREQFKIKYDKESVKFIEGFIERNKSNFGPEESKGLINSLGTFLGQCIIENYGGQWELDSEIGSMAVAFDEKNRAYPFSKVSKQFKNGLEDSIYSFYTIIPVIFKLKKKKKSWWKL
jgi:hypothetical protein